VEMWVDAYSADSLHKGHKDHKPFQRNQCKLLRLSVQ